MPNLQNLTPFGARDLLSLDRHGQRLLVVCVQATFAMPAPRQGSSSPPALVAQPDLPPVEDEYVGEPGNSSLAREGQCAYFRPGTDIYLTGHARAPGLRPVARTSIEGNPAALESSALMLSSGDEAGTLGGIISSKFKGQAGWTTFSSDVEIEGKGVVRFSDVVQQNGNTYNTAFIQQGGTGFAYGDDTQCTLCGEPPAKHRILDTVESALGIAEILRRLHANPNRYLTSGRRTKPGFMVGVLTCRCGRWATTSGDTPAAFAEAAPGYQIVEGGGVTAEELSGGDPAAAEALNGAFRTIRERRADPEVARRYAMPGMCAAAKLMRAARGHELLAMTEVFFSPQRWRQNYDVDYTNRSVNRLIPMSFRQMTQAEAAAGAVNRTVASCQSCQLILPMTLCQLQDWRC